MSTQVCNPCAEVPECWNDFDKYSLQDDLYGDVFTCPPNVFCGPPQTLYLACCDGTTMRQDFPQGITYARRQALINELVGRCERRLLFCEPFDPRQPPPLPPDPDSNYYYSAPASCTVYCPDGTPFTYTVPAGTFVSRNLADAQAAAKQLACLRAPLYRICLGSFNACWCAGSYSSASIGITSDHPPFSVAQIAGAFPAGVALTVSGNRIVIAGAPTTAGNYSFALQVTDAFGNRIARTYGISVLSITTTSLPNYTVGVAYSYQLQASGGSGNYVWSVYSGTLPEGLALSTTGLISGTPTASGVPVSLVFQVSDRTCEITQGTLYPPRARLRTTATTKMRIKRGYPVFSGTGTTLYKKITWSGSITQRSTIPEGYIAGCKYVYSGSTEIDINGNPISHHAKNLYVQCLRDIYPLIGGFWSEILGAPVTRLYGYCWPDDYLSCPICPVADSSWPLKGDYQSGKQYDLPEQIVLNESNFSSTPTTYSYSGSDTESFTSIEGVNNIPGLVKDSNGIILTSPTIVVSSTGSFGAVLSDPYTDADAIASEKTYTSTLATAENKPDYQTGAGNNFLRLLYSRYTTVDFTVTAYNLIVGRTYILSYDFKDSDGTTTAQSVTFVATASTYIHTGTVPTPASGHSITIQNQQIRYSS